MKTKFLLKQMLKIVNSKQFQQKLDKIVLNMKAFSRDKNGNVIRTILLK